MKQKTKKAAAKRFTFSAKGKVRRLRVGRSHFNGKESGNVTRRKHGYEDISSTDGNRIQQTIPYKNS